MAERREDKGSPRRGRKVPPSTRPKKRPPDKENFEWKKGLRTLIFWVFLILISVTTYRYFSSAFSGETEVSYTDYLRFLKGGNIKSAKIVETDFHGLLTDGRRIVVNLGTIDSETKKEWEKYGVEFTFQEKARWLTFFMGTLPWILIFGIWFLLFRHMQAGPRGVFSFGKSRAKLLTQDRPKISFKDVAGVDEAKEELREVIEFLKDPAKFQRLGGKIPKGTLLLGPPGTGKTLLARAVAGEAEVPFLSISGSDFVEMFVGVGASRVRDLFIQGKNNAPCIIFIDEIDAVGRLRGAGIGGGHDEREQTLNQLLVEMDGFESTDGVIIIAATNRPDVLDPALLRPGRFDRQIVIDRPDLKGREGILKVHTRNIPLDEDVDLGIIARGTPGLSGADLANIVNEATLLASRRDRDKVTMADFEEAMDKVMMGAERRSLVISEDEKRSIAYHEAGHALVSKLTPGADPVHKVTIIPRGRALGLTHYLPLDERHTHSKAYCVRVLTHLLGGRAAEKIVFDDVTTGAGNDIEQATVLARKMVCDWGMSEKLGPLTFGKKEEEIFLGREIAQHRDYSEKTAVAIDEEVRNLVEGAEKRAIKLLRENIDKLHALAAALLEREVLNGVQIDEIISQEQGNRTGSRRRSSRGRRPTTGQRAKGEKRVAEPAAAASSSAGSLRSEEDHTPSR
ncbi:MAG TPA: ATP-dependent metallopeptidase FtsH/Yme1/Tma family protein [Candidatus Latescibacteria bacterium]|nr:ATP-dependent metallopeptidase FtsH/Yme1/Tma family protein [Candidatus Latescibacterota bacterium]